ncbi:MAG: XdhC family protein [Candidatus Thermoplasmatota archaeon]|nr:XdhC family protein [Candidatus Thermoplasmatota archaeon]
MKWNAFREAAIESGISEKAVDSVRCPIGLDIGADSPEEIAVAVCAEILALEKLGDSLD